MQRHELPSFLRALIPMAGCHTKIKICSERQSRHDHSTIYGRKEFAGRENSLSNEKT